MTGPDPQNITVCNQGTRLFGFGVMVMAIAATLGGMFDPTSGDRLELLPGGFFLAVELVLLVRALRLGVTVTASTVTLRGWFPNSNARPRHRHEGEHSRIFRADNRGSTSRRYLMLELHQFRQYPRTAECRWRGTQDSTAKPTSSQWRSTCPGEQERSGCDRHPKRARSLEQPHRTYTDEYEISGTQQKWEPNEIVDIIALPVTAVDGDVVTERQWASGQGASTLLNPRAVEPE